MALRHLTDTTLYYSVGFMEPALNFLHQISKSAERRLLIKRKR